VAVSREQLLAWLGEVADPEIPVLTIADLGIVRGVQTGDTVTVQLTPTYSGCPATEAIEASVLDCLRDKGVARVHIERVLSPPWTTDWISEEGRDKLRRYGIAPPERAASRSELLHGYRTVECPRCGSRDTAIVSEFGSTACKASCKCNECLEPFEYFKCI